MKDRPFSKLLKWPVTGGIDYYEQHETVCPDWLSSLIHSNLLGLQEKPEAGFFISFKANWGIKTSHCPLPSAQPPLKSMWKRIWAVRETETIVRLEFKHKSPWLWRCSGSSASILLLHHWYYSLFSMNLEMGQRIARTAVYATQGISRSRMLTDHLCNILVKQVTVCCFITGNND